MNIRILYFGALAEITRESSETLEVEETASVGLVREILINKYPRLGTEKFKIAVNQNISNEADHVPFDAEVALLPPFAGG
tara:strand:+ start:297 stop:536 length:240 start_codon:yes stop_codon:yes gene_type:complete